MASYVTAQDRNDPRQLNQTCRQSVDLYYDEQNEASDGLTRSLTGVGISMLVLGLGVYLYYRWIDSFFKIIAAALPAAARLRSLRWNLYNQQTLAIVIIQDVFNGGDGSAIKKLAVLNYCAYALAIPAGLLIATALR